MVSRDEHVFVYYLDLAYIKPNCGLIQPLSLCIETNPFGSYLTVEAGVDHLPSLRVNIIAVQFVGQCVVSSTSEYVEMSVKGNHCVAITSLGGWRGAPQ